MVVDREGARCERDLSNILSEFSQSFDIVPRDQHAFLEIRHNSNGIIFPEENTLPKRSGGLLVSRFRDDEIRPSLFFPDISAYHFLDLVRANNMRMAREVLSVFIRAILPTDLLNPEMMGAYTRIVSRNKGLFNYMISLLRQRHEFEKIDCPHSRIVEREIVTLGQCPNLYQLCDGTDNWYNFLMGVDHTRFQTEGSSVSDRGRSPGINLKNVIGVSYAFACVPEESTSQITNLLMRLRKKATVEEDHKDRDYRVA